MLNKVFYCFHNLSLPQVLDVFIGSCVLTLRCFRRNFDATTLDNMDHHILTSIAWLYNPPALHLVCQLLVFFFPPILRIFSILYWKLEDGALSMADCEFLAQVVYSYTFVYKLQTIWLKSSLEINKTHSAIRNYENHQGLLRFEVAIEVKFELWDWFTGKEDTIYITVIWE